MAWVESLVPMGIICLSIASIGFLEGVVHRGFHYGRVSWKPTRERN